MTHPIKRALALILALLLAIPAFAFAEPLEDDFEIIAFEEVADDVESAEEAAAEVELDLSELEAPEDEEGDVEVEEIADVEEASEEAALVVENPAFVKSIEVDGVTITVKAAEGVFPDDATLSVTPVEKDLVGEVNGEVAAYYTYDIKVLNAAGDELYQPDDDTLVEIIFNAPEVANDDYKTVVFHVVDEEEEIVDELTVSEDGASASVFSDHFSFYQLVFVVKTPTDPTGAEYTGETINYTLYDNVTTYNGAIMLSTILAQAGLTEEVGSLKQYKNDGTTTDGEITVVEVDANGDPVVENQVMTITPIVDRVGSGKEVTEVYDWAIQPTRELAKNETVTVNVIWHSKTVAGYTLTWPIVFKKAEAYVAETLSNGAVVKKYASLELALTAAAADPTVDTIKLLGGTTNVVKLVEETSNATSIDIAKSLIIDLSSNSLIINKPLSISAGATVTVVADKGSAGIDLASSFATSGGATLVIDDEDVTVDTSAVGAAGIDYRSGPIVLSAGTYKIAGNTFPQKDCVADGMVAALTTTEKTWKVVPKLAINYVINGEPYTLKEADAAYGYYNYVNGLDATNVSLTAGHVFYPEMDTDLPYGKFDGWHTTETWTEDDPVFEGVAANTKTATALTLYGQLTPYVATVTKRDSTVTPYTTFIEAAGTATTEDTVTILTAPRAGDIFVLAHKYTKKDATTGEDVPLYAAKNQVTVGVAPALATKLELDTAKKINDFVAEHLDVDEGSYIWSDPVAVVGSQVYAYVYGVYQAVASVTVGGVTTPYETLYNYTAKVPNSDPVQTTTVYGATVAALGAASTSSDVKFTILNSAVANSTAKEYKNNQESVIPNPGKLKEQWVVNKDLTLVGIDAKSPADEAAGSAFTKFLNGNTIRVDLHTTLTVEPAVDSNGNIEYSYINDAIKKGNIVGTVAVTGSASSKLHYGEFTYSWMTLGGQAQWVLDNPAVTVYSRYDAATKKYADADFVGGYPTLEDAIEAAPANGGYVVLQQDMTLAKTVTVNKNVVIDLNGKTVSSGAVYTFIVDTGKTVTVGNGTVENSSANGQSRTFQVLGTLNLGFENQNTASKVVRHCGLKAVKTGGGYVINVAGGRVNVIADPVPELDDDGDPIDPSADQYVVVSGTMNGITAAGADVNGGYFTDKTSVQTAISDQPTLSLANEAPEGESGSNWWHVKTAVANNTTTGIKYASLADAVAAVAKDQTIVLLANAKVTEAIPVTKSFTLNLGGFDAYNYGGTVFTVAEGAKLTINGNGASTITPSATNAPRAKSKTMPLQNVGRILGGIVAVGSVDVNNAVVANISRTAKSDGSYSDLGTAIEFNGITTASTATTSTLTLKNSYIFGKNGVVVTGGKVANWSGAYVATSDTAMIVDSTAPASAINVTLPAGNTFTSSKGLAFEEKDNGTALPTILITGGTFTSEVKDETSTEEVKPLIVPVSFTDAFLAKVNWKDTTVTAAVTDGISGGYYSQFIPDEYCTVTTACSATAANDLYQVKSGVKFVNYYRSYTKGSGDKTTDTFVLIKTDKVVSGEATKASEVPENPTEDNKAFRYWFAFTRDQLPIPATTVPTQYNTASAVSANVDLLPYFDSWTAYITTAEGETLYFYDQNAAFEKWYDLNWTTATVDGETKTTFNPGNDLFIKYEKKTGNVVDKTYLVKLDGIANTFVKGQASNVIAAAKAALDVLYNKDTIANADSVSFEVAVTANNDIYTASVEAVPCLNGAQVYNRQPMTPANNAFVEVAEYDFEITAPETYASLASIAVVQYSNSGATTQVETYSNQAISDGKVLATGIKNLNNRYFRLSNVVARVDKVRTGGGGTQYNTSNTYPTLDAAVKAALLIANTDSNNRNFTITITLLSDIALTAPQAIDFTATGVLANTVTLNLNGFTLSNDPAANAALSSILNVTGASGKTLNITDTEKGAVVNTTGAALNANASTTVAISAGAFTGTTAAITSEGTMTISGGSYKATTGASDLSGTGIKASAGIFAHTVADSYCATNYKTTANTDKETKEEYPFTLVSGAVAEYDGLYYADLADAVAAVPANGTGTVNLIAASTDSGTKKHVVIPAGSNITIDLKGNSVGYTVKSEVVDPKATPTVSKVFPAITVEGTLTLMDSGKGSGMIKDYGTYTVNATSNATTPAIKVEKGGSLTLDANFSSNGNYAIESEGTVVVPKNEVQEFSISGATAALVMDNSKGGAAATIEGAIFRANELNKPVLSVAYMLDNEGDPITTEPNKDAILKGFVSGGKFSAKIDKKFLATGKVMSDTTLPGGLYFVADGVTVTLNSGNEKVKFTDYDEDGNPLATQVTTLVLTGAKGTKLNELLHYPANELKLDKHTFDGWLDANGNKVAVDAVINESVELTAQWIGQLFDVKLIYSYENVQEGNTSVTYTGNGNSRRWTQTQQGTKDTITVVIADASVLAPYTAYLKDQYNIVRTVDTTNKTITFSGVPYGMKVDELVLTKAKTVQGADGKDVTYGPEISGPKTTTRDTGSRSRTVTGRYEPDWETVTTQYSDWRWNGNSTPLSPVAGAVVWKSNGLTKTAVDDTWTLDESTTPKYIVGTADIETGTNKTITLYNGYTVMGTPASIAYGTALTKAQTKDYLDGMLKAGAGAATVEDAVKALNLTKNKQDGERKAIHADDAYTPAADSLVMTENQIYALKWVDQVYVTFHFNKADGTAATEVVNVDKGATYSKIVAPDLDPAAGTTVQWMTAQTGGSVVDLTSTTQIITADMDLWASVTTTKNMTYNAPATQTVDYTGSQASAVVTVSDPTNAKIEYSTDGGVNWASTNKVGPASGDYTINYRLTAPGYNTVVGSIKLTIDKQKWDVTFNTDGGTAIAAQKVKDGETATKPADPTKEGYNFVKWVDANGAEFVFTTPIHAATVITAIWQKSWTLTFMDGETEFMKQTVVDGELPLVPESPTKEYYVFDKWVDAEGNAFDATKPVTASATYVATWTDTIFLTGSIDLQSSIGLNAYVHLPDGENPADYTAKYSYESYIQPKYEREYSFEGQKTRDRQRGDEKVPCYLIKLAELGSDEMVDEATLIVYKKGEKVAEKKYSIRNYVAEQLAAGGLDPDLEKLFRSVLQYGHYAQIQFKNHTDDLPSTEGAPALVPIPSSYAVSGDPTLASVKEFSASLALDTSVDMTVYITPADGYELKDFTISVKDKDGKDYTNFTEPKIRKGAVYFKIQGIYSDQMSDQFTITVTDKDGKSASWVRSLMNCAYDKEQTSTEKNMKDLMEALYQFHMAAKTWFA